MTTISIDRRKIDFAEWLTFERLLFGVILLIATSVRLAGLNDQPLSPAEAAGAWPAWLRVMGLDAPVDAVPDSALLYSMQSLLFWLTGGGDAIARLAAAVAGIALVWLPWLWRNWLGRSTSLSIALLVAVNPWLVAFSRLASGTALSLLLFAVVLTCLMLLQTRRDPHRTHRTWIVLALTGGLLLTSGPLVWSALPILAAFIWLYGLPPLPTEAHLDNDPDLELEATKDPTKVDLTEQNPTAEDLTDPKGGTAQSIALLFLFFLGAVLLGSTSWLSHPQGLSHIGNSLDKWLIQIGAGPYPLAWLFLRIAAEGLMLLFFAVLGTAMLWSGRGSTTRSDGQRWATFLILWFAWSIVLLLVPGRLPMTLPLLGLGLILAAGHVIGTLFERMPSAMDWRETTIVLVVVLVLLVAISFWGRILLASSQLAVNSLAIVVLLIASLGLVMALYAAWAGRRNAFWLGGMLLVGLLLFSSISSMWALSHGQDMAAPDGLFVQVAAPDVRLLAQDVATLSAQQVGDAGEIPLQVQMKVAADPVLGWYLRDMRRLQWVLTPEIPLLSEPRPLAVTLDSTLVADGAYLGGAYDVRTIWSPSSLWTIPTMMPRSGEQSSVGERLQESLTMIWGQRLQPIIRWLIYREIPTMPETDIVILWAPAQTD